MAEETDRGNDRDLAWEEVRTEHVIRDRWMDLRRSAFRYPDGKIWEPYYNYTRRDYAIVVASDEEGNYLCVRQFRQGIRKVTTEFPAGGAYLECKAGVSLFPYDNKVVEFKLTGKQLREALLYMFRDESIDAPDDGGEFYQLSKGIKVVYFRQEHRLETLELNGHAIQDDDMIKVAMGDFHYNNIDNFLQLNKDDIKKNGTVKTLSSSDYIIVEERMSGVPLIRVDKEERITIK